MATWLNRNWKWMALTFAVVGWIVAATSAIVQHQPIPAPVVFEQTGPPLVEPGAMGWHNDPAEVASIVAGLPIKAFQWTPAFQAVTPDHAYLWESAIKATGAQIPARNQGQVGSCTAFGGACADEYLQCVQIVSGTCACQFKTVAQEVIYGGGRVQIGGGKMRGDGSTGAWTAQWVQKYGIVPRGVYGSIDLTSYSEARCRQYGNSGCSGRSRPDRQTEPGQVHHAGPDNRRVPLGPGQRLSGHGRVERGLRQPRALRPRRPGFPEGLRDLAAPDVLHRLPAGRPPGVLLHELLGSELGERTEGRRQPSGRRLLDRRGHGRPHARRGRLVGLWRHDGLPGPEARLEHPAARPAAMGRRLHSRPGVVIQFLKLEVLCSASLLSLFSLVH